MNPSTAPALTTALVWSDVPEAIFVSAQADSNWRSGLAKVDNDYSENQLLIILVAYLVVLLRNSTSLGTTLALMRISIGGFLSLLRILQAACVAVISLFSSSLLIPLTPTVVGI